MNAPNSFSILLISIYYYFEILFEIHARKWTIATKIWYEKKTLTY